MANLSEAENYYLRADMAMEAVEMYSKAGKWEAAQKVARGYLSDADTQHWYRRKAREFEALHKHKEAEKCFVQAEEFDLAINMYKKARMYDQMIRLVLLPVVEAEVAVGTASITYGYVGLCAWVSCPSPPYNACVTLLAAPTSCRGWACTALAGPIVQGAHGSRKLAHSGREQLLCQG